MRQERQKTSAVAAGENVSEAAIVAIGAIVRRADRGEHTALADAVVATSGLCDRWSFAHG